MNIAYSFKKFLVKYDLSSSCPVCGAKLLEVGYPTFYGFISHQKVMCPTCGWNLGLDTEKDNIKRLERRNRK